MVKYVLHPGKVKSKNDGDLHHVGARALIHLYRIDPREAEVVQEHKVYPPDVIHLMPDYRGKYKIPRRG